ncbi:hypothetical protein D3C86_1789830 [compost metagenome]
MSSMDCELKLVSSRVPKISLWILPAISNGFAGLSGPIPDVFALSVMCAVSVISPVYSSEQAIVNNGRITNHTFKFFMCTLC